MGILQFACPAIVICTGDRDRATAFYRDTIGLEFVSENNLAAIFNTGGVMLRVSHVPGFVPHEHTILGFRVADVNDTVRALREKGVKFKVFPAFPQDKLGILSLPGGVQVAWFQDPDGNLLSVTNA